MIHSKIAKVISGIATFATAFAFALPASAMTTADLQAQISALQAQLSSMTGSTSMMSTCYTFSTNLKVGSRSADVMSLQKTLNMSSDTMVASSGAGSMGSETSFFGPATKRAVMKFQAKYGISPVAGFVGAITRAKLNSMCVAGTTTGTTTGTGTTATTTGTTMPTGGALTVSMASEPANSLAPQSAARVPFTAVTLTAGASDVTVNSITVQRSGLAQDAVFSGVVLLKADGTQIGIAKTLNSNHQAMVGEPWVIKAGTSQTVTVAGNMNSNLSTYAGQVAGLDVVGINTSATVGGSLPITGAMHTINASLTLGSVTIQTSSFDPGSAQNKEIGTTGYKFSGIRITAGSAEQVKVWSVRWNQSGSASSGDLANVMVYVNGTGYPTTISADGKYYSASFPGGILLDKGNSVDMYIAGDIVGSGAAGRTVKFDIYKTTDLYISGVTYGYGITPPTGSVSVPSTITANSVFTTGTPWFFGSQVSVTAGAITSIQKSTSVAAQNIAVNVPNQILGGYDTNFRGEPISVQSSVFHFTTSPTQSGLLTNVSLVDSNGAVVAGPVDAVLESGSNQKVTFTDTVTYPVGSKTYTLKGKIPTGFANNVTVIASTTPSTDWTNVTGQTTGNSISLSTYNSAIAMNTMTVKAAALAITTATTPSAQSIVAGGQAVTFANYQFDASQSGEDVRFSTVPLTLAASSATNLNTCQLYDGSTVLNTGSNVVNPSATGQVTFTLDQQIVIPKGTIKTLTLKCNVSSGATGTANWGFTSLSGLTVTGVTSSNTVTPSFSTSVGQVQTIGSGSLVVSLDSNSPSYAVVAAGTTGNIIGAYKFRATNEAINLTRIGLKLTNTASSSASDLVQVSIWDGATQVGTATFTGSGAYATSTFSSAVVLPKDTDKTLTIKADLASVGTSLSGNEGALIAVDINSADTTGTQGTGVASGNTINATGSTAVAGVRMYKAFPVFTYSNTGGTATNGTNDLLALNVTANGTGDVTLNKLTFAVSTTSATLTSPTFSGPNGSVGTVALNAAGTLITVTFDSVSNTQDKTVSVGNTKIYTLRGTIALTGNSGSTGSVGIALKADTSHPSLSTLMGTVAQLSGSNIIWSPNSTTSPASVSAVDWTNGYGLQGCFATSGLGQDCFSRVTSK